MVVRDHLLNMVDRNDGPDVRHIHRWRPTCTCGWAGVNRKRRADARRLFEAHAESQKFQARGGRGRRRTVGPGELTPTHMLPAELRPST